MSRASASFYQCASLHLSARGFRSGKHASPARSGRRARREADDGQRHSQSSLSSEQVLAGVAQVALEWLAGQPACVKSRAGRAPSLDDLERIYWTAWVAASRRRSPVRNSNGGIGDTRTERRRLGTLQKFRLVPARSGLLRLEGAPVGSGSFRLGRFASSAKELPR